MPALDINVGNRRAAIEIDLVRFIEVLRAQECRRIFCNGQRIFGQRWAMVGHSLLIAHDRDHALIAEPAQGSRCGDAGMGRTKDQHA